MNFREAIKRFLPMRWAQGPKAQRFLHAIGLHVDAVAEQATEGMRARFPQYAPSDALAYIGKDRSIVRGPGETDEEYAARLLRWIDDQRIAGSANSVMQQVRGYLRSITSLTQSPPRMRLVNSTGTFQTLNSDGTFETYHGTWDWDGNSALPVRAWLIIYSIGGSPWNDEGLWGDGNTFWGDGGTWGTDATLDHVAAIRAIVATWKGAGTLYPNIIISFDNSLFDPTNSSTLPDGQWGNWHKVVAGSAVASRFADARYWDGAA
jgi:hypothetical protein